MICLSAIIFTWTYVNGIVAGIQSSPVYWSEIVCRAKFENVTLSNPDQPEAKAFIQKRVYDRLIIDYHRLTEASSQPESTKPCEKVHSDARIVLNWLQKQRKVWGKNSESSFRTLLESLERRYEVSWR